MQQSIFKKPRHKILPALLAIFIALLISGSYFSYAYIKDYYHALDYASESLIDSESVTVSHLDKHTLVFSPDTTSIPANHKGIIFYPGGKVEYTAYAPLLNALAQNGFLCVLVHMPGNLAVFDSNAADGIAAAFPDIDSWYLCGHSLGGAMAASYIYKHQAEYDGIILLAAYPTKDLSQSDLSLISIYGSEDQVLNANKYADNRNNFPENAFEYIIDGGCHAYFGCYGPQDGDGIPTITNQEQLQTTVDFITHTLLP